MFLIQKNQRRWKITDIHNSNRPSQKRRRSDTDPEYLRSDLKDSNKQYSKRLRRTSGIGGGTNKAATAINLFNCTIGTININQRKGEEAEYELNKSQSELEEAAERERDGWGKKKSKKPGRKRKRC